MESNAFLPNRSQLALRSSDLQQTTTVAQHNLASVVCGYESDFLEPIFNVSCSPNLGGKLVAWKHRRSKACLEFSQVLWITASKLSQNAVSGSVPAEETVDDNAPKSHLLTGLRCSMKRVIVAIETSKNIILIWWCTSKDLYRGGDYLTDREEQFQLSFEQRELHPAFCLGEGDSWRRSVLWEGSQQSDNASLCNTCLPLGPPQLPCPTMKPLLTVLVYTSPFSSTMDCSVSTTEPALPLS